MINAVLKREVESYPEGTLVQVIRDHNLYYLYSHCKVVATLSARDLNDFIEVKDESAGSTGTLESGRDV